MLDDTTSEDNHRALLGLQCAVVEQTNVLDKVHDETFFTPRLEEDDVTESSISEGWAEDRDVVLLAPVVDAILVVDAFTDEGDDFLRRPNRSLRLLLLVHLLDNRLEPGLKELIVLVGNDEVADSV